MISLEHKQTEQDIYVVCTSPATIFLNIHIISSDFKFSLQSDATKNVLDFRNKYKHVTSQLSSLKRSLQILLPLVTQYY
jgi:hypothetical protein